MSCHSRDMCLSDLEAFHLKVDLKRERNQKSLIKDQKFESTLAQPPRPDLNSCEVCREKKGQVDSTFGGQSAATVSSLFTRDSEKPKPWTLGGKVQIEPRNKSTLCTSHALSLHSPRPGPEPDDQGPWGAFADGQHWHDVSVYLGLADCSAKHAEKLGIEGGDAGAKVGATCCRKTDSCHGERDACTARCCHPRNFVVEAPGHMSDVEWMSIFRPPNTQRIVRYKTGCTCSGSAIGTEHDPFPR